MGIHLDAIFSKTLLATHQSEIEFLLGLEYLSLSVRGKTLVHSHRSIILLLCAARIYKFDSVEKRCLWIQCVNFIRYLLELQ